MQPLSGRVSEGDEALKMSARRLSETCLASEAEIRK